MLPKPSVTFTIPSIYDHTKLDCRLFHPTNLAPHSAKPWTRRAAIVAHPYAPLGGCYDDPVVDVVAGTLLQLGFLVATFNFRGASTSDGRTSWTSKPERADYQSVAGFLAYYVHYLDDQHARDGRGGNSGGSEQDEPLLLLGGYSYGAMITIKIPPLETILGHFITPAVHTAEADIRLRAQHLAEQHNALFATPTSPRKSLGVRVGGDEEVPRRSQDMRKSFTVDNEDRIRHGVKELLAKTKRIRRKRHIPRGADGVDDHDNDHAQEHSEEEYMEPVDRMTTFRSAYLMVSPPVGLATNLATMSFSNPLGSISRRFGHSEHTRQSAAGTPDDEDATAELKLVKHPALVVYGDQDGFTAVKKIRDWAAQLTNAPGSLCQKVEVSGAGHFWVEEGVMRQLRDAVGQFGTERL